jgi:glyoxylase-like metal-dependent hydrolase (beta-lactamase superfamily II)
VTDHIQLGNATLTRVVELQVGGLSHELFPQTPADERRELAAEYTPTFWGDAGWRIALQTWVVEVGGLTVLVDTGAGNDRDRPAMPPIDHLGTDLLDALRAAGVEPDAVDVVINTHIHSDHVGWNTMRRSDSWVPTFPNARYVMPEIDYRYFHPDNADNWSSPRTEADAARQAGWRHDATTTASGRPSRCPAGCRRGS